ncbi:hypothetical protein I5192_20080 (plasmid) [Ruegeria sp. SCSIO 43209]|uniref:hypothetical protein n=1 Tax=Ruegeria sp. SCSIO 43209 TaxID=2793010 RepID=UPI001CA997C8|nr:hypothetical protein [Ruegeria sp. SCSIO 43209]UAB91535.1 hypothetical protein I5192_20080 [Ruegeria sp. SCSIO 43209]
MNTRLNPLAGRYFNDPTLAASVSSLAEVFAPPTANEQYAWARASNERAEGQRLADLWAAAGDDFDKQGAAVGQWNPNQSYYAVDTADATTRRGQDIAAETSRMNNDADNVAALEEAKLAALIGLGDTVLEHGEAMVGISPEVAEALNIPAFPSQTGEALGAPAPLPSEDEVEARLFEEAIRDGLFDTQDLLEERRSDVNVETIETPDGPRIATRADAIGQAPHINRGTQAAPELETYRTPDGQTGTAEFDVEQRRWVDTQTRRVLPEGTVTGKISDTSEGFGATTSNVTRGNAIIAEAQYGLERVSAFRELLEQNPGIMGIPGMIRGLAQDVVAAADEAGAAFGTIDSVDEARALAARIGASGDYDPAFAQAAAYALEMAYLQAKAQDPGGEVNVRELERQIGLYDGGIAGNSKVLAVLDALEPQLHDRMAYGAQLRGETAPTAAADTGSPQSLSDADLFRKYGLE